MTRRALFPWSYGRGGVSIDVAGRRGGEGVADGVLAVPRRVHKIPSHLPPPNQHARVPAGELNLSFDELILSVGDVSTNRPTNSPITSAGHPRVRALERHQRIHERLPGGRQGRVAQVDPIRPMLKAPRIQLLIVKTEIWQTAFKICFQIQRAPLKQGARHAGRHHGALPGCMLATSFPTPQLLVLMIIIKPNTLYDTFESWGIPHTLYKSSTLNPRPETLNPKR